MRIHPIIYREFTMREHAILHRVKLLACCLGICLGLCGCQTIMRPGWGIMNNTGHDLVVYQDAKLIAKMPPGTVINLGYPMFLYREFSLVNVAAYDSYGGYRGGNSYTFSKFAPYNWQIDHVYRQEYTQ